MSISAVGGMAAPQTGRPTEITTVTTHCPKKHWHDQSCPHTVSTVPASSAEAANKAENKAARSPGETGDLHNEAQAANSAPKFPGEPGDLYDEKV